MDPKKSSELSETSSSASRPDSESDSALEFEFFEELSLSLEKTDFREASNPDEADASETKDSETSDKDSEDFEEADLEFFEEDPEEEDSENTPQIPESEESAPEKLPDFEPVFQKAPPLPGEAEEKAVPSAKDGPKEHPELPAFASKAPEPPVDEKKDLADLPKPPAGSSTVPPAPQKTSFQSGSQNAPEPSVSRRFNDIVRVLKKNHALRQMTPVKLRLILEELGPTYVKLGQILSSRQDLLPPSYTHELESLRASVKPLPYETIRQEIINTYGKSPEELFSSFSKTPLGSASMAQVHEAVTKDGSRVVVKVQRPGIARQMKVDVDMMRRVAKLLSRDRRVASLMDPEEIVEEFWTTTQEELDFRHEAANALRFRTQNEGLNYIEVPRIHEEFTRRNILVMDEVDGAAIDDYDSLTAQGYSRQEIAMRLGLNFLDQMISARFFHADPHSGNLKISKGKICWLDFGMMGEITPGEAQAISSALQAVAARNVSALTNAVLEIGIAPDDLDYIGFSNALESYLNRYVTQSFEDLDLAKMVEEAVEVCHQYRIRLPKGIAMLARSLVTIQGTLKDLDPHVNMLAYISKEKSSIDQIDWNREMEEFLRQAYADSKALMNLPLKADHILGLLQKGQLRIGISVADLKEVILPDLNQIVDRIVVCILIAALLVGSSIVCTTGMKPTFLEIPLLGFAGFFVSFCLSLWLFYKMIFHPKKGDRLF